MGKWISKLFGSSPHEGTSGSGSSNGYANLDNHFRRLLEIEQALGEIGALFSGEPSQSPVTSKAEDPIHQISALVNRMRVPGFFAYHLAQEGLAVLNIIAACVALAKKNVGASGNINTIMSHIDEVEPMFRQSLYDMEPYKSMDAKEAIEAIAARIAEHKRK